MYFRKLFFLSVFLTQMTFVLAADSPSESPDGKMVEKIDVVVKNQAPNDNDNTLSIVSRMQTKSGEKFDQNIFDRDLKELSKTYEWVEPTISVENGKVIIHLVIKKKPTIDKLFVEGSSFSSKKLLKEGDLHVGITFDREDFAKSIAKIRDFLIKKGYFKADITYKVENSPVSNLVNIYIFVNEGPHGRINAIIFEGFTKQEEKEVMDLIHIRKYNLFTSWLTGSGTLKQEELDPEVQTIVHYFQNHGYVNAHVSISLRELPDKKLGLVIHVDKGEKYYINTISFSGYHIKNEEELKKTAALKPGEVFSIDKIREAQLHIRELYTDEGYLHTNVNFTLKPSLINPEYNVEFTIEESEKYRVGLVLVSGNYHTRKNTIQNLIQIEPGDVYDSRKVKATQENLQSTGFFKNVNVYPVKSENHEYGSSEYTDVMIEVDEKSTGNASIFGGVSSQDAVFGGIDITENNFDIRGFRNMWTDGPSAFRGGGQYLGIKATIGAKENGVNLSWMEPYLNDSLWKLGTNFSYNQSQVISTEYNIHTLEGNVSLNYPISAYVNSGGRLRVKNANIRVSPDSPPLAREQKQNSGIVSGVAWSIGYDSTDNTSKPRSGLRSTFEAEFAGLIRNDPEFIDFPFLRFGYINSYYYPLWKKGTVKLRGDFKFINPTSGGTAQDLPLTERFFLGGESSVRGYAPAKLGPLYGKNEPTGGISSSLFSLEYAQNIYKPIDAFLFFDAGSISLSRWNIDDVRMTCGVGLRLDIGRRFPFVVGYGYAINPPRDSRGEVLPDVLQPVFFSMAGQF